MFSASDFEKFRFLFKTAGEPKGISLNSFCAGHATFNASTPLVLQRCIAAPQHLSYGYNCRKNRLAEFDPCLDIRKKIIITKKSKNGCPF